jgi:chromatin segregation and condensation protein Rec8/ScpA/Scc1 (kleisin family)
LLAYKKHRDAADALDRRREQWEARFPAGGAGFDREAVADVVAEKSAEFDDELEIYDLVEAFAQILAQIDMTRIGAHHVAMETDDTPIEVHAADILTRLRGAPESGHALSLRALFADHSRVQMIGLFLATLELVRQQRVKVEQSTREEPLLLRLVLDEVEDPIEPMASPEMKLPGSDAESATGS